MTREVLNAAWPVRSLLDIADLVRGVTYKREEARTQPGPGLTPILRATNISGGVLNFDDLVYVPDRRVSPEQRIRRGDIVVAMSSGSRNVVGKAAFAHSDWPGGFGAFCGVLRVHSGVDAGYLARFLQSTEYRDQIESVATGTNINNLSRATLGIIEVPIAPLDVQAQLSGHLERIETKTDTSAAHLAAAKVTVQRFRQAALASAWREASEASPALRLEELLAEPMRNGYSARPVNRTTPFRVLTLTATTSGWFDERHFKYTAEEFGRDSPFWVRPSDILVQRGNTAEYVGVPALYEGEDHQFLYPDLMIRIRVRPDVGARYVWYMLLSPQLRNLVREQATGSAGNMPKVNQKILNDVSIPMPDIERRAQIVNRLDRALNLAARLEKRIDTASRHVGLSSQATLVKAFRGTLPLPLLGREGGQS